MQMWTASVGARTLTRSLCHYLCQCQALCSTAPTPVPQKLIPRTQPHVPTICPPHHPDHHLQRHLWTSARFFWTLSLAAGGTSDHEQYHITHWVKVACLSEDLGILAEPCQDYTRPCLVAQTPRIALAQPPLLSMVSQLFPFHCDACFFSMKILSCLANIWSTGILVQIDTESITLLLHICYLNICENLLFHHIPNVLCWIEIWLRVEALDCCELLVGFLTPVWDKSFVTWCIIGHGQQQCSSRLLHLNDGQFVLRGPKRVKKISLMH